VSVASQDVSLRLAEIVGGENVLAERARVAEYAIGGMAPATVARPSSGEEVAEILKFAAAERLAVVPTGARTKLGMFLPPRRYDVALDMSRQERLIAYDPGDLTLSVEAGMPLAKLAETLEQHGQFLPLDAPFFSRATVGGTISVGVDSPLRQMYGTARDYVLGMEFVTGEGTLAKSGGRVVKNVAGYDLHKLMIGALGTLGAITKIHFRTFPRPADVRGFAAIFEDAAGALEMRRRIAESPLALMTLEILSARAGEILAGETFFPKHWTLVASFAGNESVLARQERELRRMAEECGARDTMALDEERAASAMARVREFAAIILDASPAAVIVKMGVPPARMKEILDAGAVAAETHGLAWAAMARGCGVIYFALLPGGRSEESRTAVAAAGNRIIASCAALGGNATVPWSPAEWKGALRVWGAERSDFDAMRSVKKVFDPQGILSPGRFIG